MLKNAQCESQCCVTFIGPVCFLGKFFSHNLSNQVLVIRDILKSNNIAITCGSQLFEDKSGCNMSMEVSY